MRHILQDGFLFVHISFVCIIKFQFLAHFPVDLLPHQVVYIIIIIIIIIHSLELFTSTLADDFSLEAEWQQVSSSLQDSS